MSRQDNYSASLNKYLSSVPHDNYVDTLRQLSDYLGVSNNVIYNLRTGRTYLRKSYRNAIETFFKTSIF